MSTPIVLVRVAVRIDKVNLAVEVPALLTPAGLITSLLDYFLEKKQAPSPAWMLKVAGALRFYLQYSEANSEIRDPFKRFMGFAQRLHSGTFDRTGFDETNLCWPRRTAITAAQIIGLLSDFFDWLAPINPNLGANPVYSGNAFERSLANAANEYKKSKAFLGHTWSRDFDAENTKGLRRISKRRAPHRDSREPPSFPEGRFDDLINEGFLGKRLRITAAR